MHRKSRLLFATALLVILAFPLHTFARSVREERRAYTSQQARSAIVTPLIPYQGRLLDPVTGEPKPDGTYTIAFRLYTVAEGGSPVWTETKSVQVQKGLFATYLGDTAALDPALFDGSPLWLGISVGADPEASPRMRLGFAPYAIWAATAGTLEGHPASDFASASHAHDARYVNISGDTMKNQNDSAAILTIVQTGDNEGLNVSTDATTDGQAAIHGLAGKANVLIRGVHGVLGESNRGMGVVGISATGRGVVGWTTNGEAGVSAESKSGYGLFAYSESKEAIYAYGSVRVTKDLRVDGTIQNTMVPIALGFVRQDGSAGAVSPGVTVKWDNVGLRYRITIAGHSYFWTNYVTVVAPACSEAKSYRVSSVGGDLLVYFYNSSDLSIQCAFQFVTYKP